MDRYDCPLCKRKQAGLNAEALMAQHIREAHGKEVGMADFIFLFYSL